MLDFNFKPRNNRLIAAAFVTFSLALAACQALPPMTAAPAAAPDAPTTQTVNFKGADFKFEGPSEIQSGWVTVNFQNVGQEVHHAQLAKLNDGVTMDQVQKAFQTSEAAVFEVVTFVGGPSAIDPNGNASVTLNLPEGQYIVTCFIPSADGVPHFAKGMLSPFTVKGAPSAGAAEPKADLSINLMDFHITMPAEVKAGKQVWKIINDGPQPHEISLIKLAPDKTADDVFAWFAKPDGPPPFEDLGGMQAMNKGVPATYINLDLAPGNYVAVCNIPDAKSGKAHAELGMVMPFTVK